MALARTLHGQLAQIRQGMLALEAESAERLAAVASGYHPSARNLLHFIALHRRHHVGLADQLHQLGLSSLAGSDPHVLRSVDAVLAALQALQGLGVSPPGQEPSPDPKPDPMASRCSQLFGSLSGGPGIMVTLPAEAAHDAEAGGLIAQLLASGMTLARINCAHDDASVWRELAGRVARQSAALGTTCRIAVDLAGPKLRTGGLPALEGVVRVRPPRDRYGRLIEPAIVLAAHHPAACAQLPGAVKLPVELADWQAFRPGEVLSGTDASGRSRTLTVEAVEPWGLRLSVPQQCRFTAGLRFTGTAGAELVVAPLPPEPGCLVLEPGDRLWLLGEAEAPAHCPHPAVSCSLPELIPLIGQGERVMFDDGKITAVVIEPGEGRLLLEVTAARGGRARLRGDKGINFPDSTLHTPALTAKDIDDLEFAVAAGDIVNFSFVHSPADIAALHRELQRHRREDLAVVLKIETRQAYEGLPDLLLEAMRYPAPLGVMIARGDLAVECGWESLAQIQHDILRLCAAAHVPCIWATQVLDELARHGLPTRAEITDAAMGAQAHALMLNKGPNITEAVRVLRTITQGALKANRSDRLVSCLAYRSNCPG